MMTAKEPKIYECGTLRYTTGSLIFTSALLVLAFFSISVVTQIVNITTLKLKDLGATDFIIAFITSTITGIFNLTVCPTVSFKSDRYRGKRWGRRNVFIVAAIPMICLSLLGFALSDATGLFVSKLLKPWIEVSPATLAIAMIGLMMMIYRFFYMFVSSVIYYLYNDIIPQSVLARVIGVVQVSTTLASAMFNMFFFRFALTHFSLMMFAGALIYFFGVGAMCLFVKEPKLPPLTEEEKKQSRGTNGLKTFMTESFSHRYYWYNCFGTAFWAVAAVIGTFTVFFYKNMGLSLEEYGRLLGISGMIGFGLGFLNATVGALLIDKWHPVRVHNYSFAFLFVMSLTAVRWIFVDIDSTALFIIALVGNVTQNIITNISNLSSMPTLTRTMPKSRFGQFCSANAMVRSLVTLSLGLLAGLAIDVTRKLTGQGDFVYRYIFIWNIVFLTIGIIFKMLCYREYIKLGGITEYKAPAPWSPEKVEELPQAESCPTSRIKARPAFAALDILVGIFFIAPLGFSAFGFYINAFETAKAFVFYAFPASAVVAVLWLLTRRAMLKNYPADRTREVCDGIVHHGIIYLTGFWMLLAFIRAAIQSAMIYRDANALSAKLWAFEALVAGVLFILMLIFNRMEAIRLRKNGI